MRKTHSVSFQLDTQVAVNVSRGEQTFPQIMADFSFVYTKPLANYIFLES